MRIRHLVQSTVAELAEAQRITKEIIPPGTVIRIDDRSAGSVPDVKLSNLQRRALEYLRLDDFLRGWKMQRSKIGDVLDPNHEFYKGHIDHTLRKMREMAAPHVHVLENQVWICNQTRFLVSTGWTDFSSTGDPVEAMVTCGLWMNDFQVIRVEERLRRLRPSDVIERNRDAFDFLVGELAQPFEGKTIVVTHHCPVPEVAGEKHDGHLSAAYTNRWHSLLSMVDVWIFGHTHRAIDIELGGCRLISNPRGYPQEFTGFISDFTMEI
ncbi:serine/threonine protein phosphatase [Pseudomonas migulae]